MKQLTAVLFVLLMISAATAQIHVMPGMKMPEVTADWLTAVKHFHSDKNSKTMEIVVFTDINSPDIIQTLRYLESLESKYIRQNPGKWIFKFQVVVPNDKSDAERFLKTAETPFTIAFGTDIGRKTFRNFVVARVPEAIIGTDGVITWQGPVMDLDHVMDSILTGTFSLQEYRKISQLKQEMQTALRSGLPDVAARTAEKILEKIPGDTVSIQTVLYSYELKNQHGKAIAFLEDRIAKNGKKSAGIRLLLLDRIIRSGDMTLWKKHVQEAVQNTTFPDDKLNLAAFLIERSPRFQFPVTLVPELCQNILKDPAAASDPEFHANALEISALAEYKVCRIGNALEYQNQAAELRKKNKSPFLARTLQTLTFFQTIKEQAGKK